MVLKTGYTKILTAACIWGTVGVFARWSGLNPIELSFYKTFLASICLLSLMPREQLLFTNKSLTFSVIAVTGVLYAFDVFLFFYAISLTTMSNALFAYYMQPVFVAFLLPFFINERHEFKNALALLIAVTGLFLILMPSVLHFSREHILGIIFALLAALGGAAIVILVKAINLSSSVIVYYQMIIASLCLAPFVNFSEGLSFYQFTIIITLGIIHTALPYSLYYSGLKAVKASLGITLSYVDPVIASFAGVLLFGEPFTFASLIGGVMIIISGLIVVSH